MNSNSNLPLSPVLYLSHGGGPLPLLGDKGHQNLINFFREVTPALGIPTAILVISAHWEEAKSTITSGTFPALIYDYYGFPKESYDIKYPAPGSPELANQIFNLLGSAGIEAKLDPQRGFDHGLFVPLKIMCPEANIPCVQLSLVKSLNAEEHIDIGNLSPTLGDVFVTVGTRGQPTTQIRDADPNLNVYSTWVKVAGDAGVPFILVFKKSAPGVFGYQGQVQCRGSLGVFNPVEFAPYINQ